MNIYSGTLAMRYDPDLKTQTVVSSTSEPGKFQEALKLLYGDAHQPADTAETETFVRKKLSAQDLAELSAKYDPRHMTQSQYDSFLEDLIEKGALSKFDAMRVGYKGFRVLDIDPETFGTRGGGGTCYVTRQENFGDELVQSLDDADGDLVRWVQIMLTRGYIGTDLFTQNGIREREEVLSVLSDIINRM